MSFRIVAFVLLPACGCGSLGIQPHDPAGSDPSQVAAVVTDYAFSSSGVVPPSASGSVRLVAAQSTGSDGLGGEIDRPGDDALVTETPSADSGTRAETTPLPAAPDRAASDRDSAGGDSAGGPSGSGVAAPNDLTDDIGEDQPTGPPLGLGEVLGSVYASYPLLDAAYDERTIASGNAVSAQGEFDTKLKGATENQPLGFYENYRHRVAVEQPLFGGSDVFSQYRMGRGFYEPWYKERQTDDGGEFRAGIVVPLLRGQEIDPRRADLFRANVARNAVEPDIRAQLLDFTRAAAYAYWGWVAAGQNYRVADALVENADRRVDALRRRAEAGDVEPIVLVDNERLVVSRQAKRIDAERKVREAAVKLSLFYRDGFGRPVVVTADRLPPDLPPPAAIAAGTDADIARALAIRPELQALAFQRRQIGIDLRQANNELLPAFGAGLVGSQDVGEPSSRSEDKSEFELEAGLTFDVPLQRRKARGKITAAEGKLAQLNAKSRFTRDKIAAEVRAAAVALAAAAEQYDQAARSLELARLLEDAERRKFDLGESDLFLVNAREQQTAEASLLVVEALYAYQVALADQCAAVGELPAISEPAATRPISPPPAPVL